MKYPSLVASLALALAVACGGEAEAPADSTTETSRGLLSSIPSDAPAGERRVPADETVSQEVIEVDVRLLGHDRGDSLAPVQIVEMSDYGCGYCRQFHDETWPVVLEDFIETGKVHWKFLPFVTGMFDNSLAATEAAECALAQGPDLFRVLNERLWDDQASWKRSDDAQAVVRRMAGDAGVEMGAWDACMASDDRMERIRAATALSRELGVRGTPTFFVMGYPPLPGALPTETFTRILQMVWAQSTAESGTGGPEGGL